MAKLIEVTIDGMSDLLKNIDLLKNNTINAQAVGMALVTVDVANYAKQNHPFQNRTEKLENSIQPLPVKLDKDNVIEGSDRASMEYAEPVEFGTSRSRPYPFMIPARDANAKNLRDTMAKVQERVQQSLKVTK